MLQSKEMIASELRRLSKFNHNVVKAARAGNLQDMEENLKEGDINFQDNYGWTPLMWATYRGNLDCVEALIARGATSTKKSKDGWPALCIAVSLNNIDAVKTLLTDRIGNINIKGNAGLTPLMMACGLGHFAMCQLLLKEGARVNQQSFNGLTALMRAADTGNLGIAVLLLFHSADPRIRDKDSHDAIYWARRKGHAAIADVLADWPGVPELKRTGRSPLDWAEENLKQEIVELLIDWKERATRRKKSRNITHQIGKKVLPADLVFVEDLAGGQSCAVCGRHGLPEAWHDPVKNLWICKLCELEDDDDADAEIPEADGSMGTEELAAQKAKDDGSAATKMLEKQEVVRPKGKEGEGEAITPTPAPAPAEDSDAKE